MISTTDFTETLESMMKKVEGRIYAQFQDVSQRTKTYADILVSFYLTDVKQPYPFIL